MWKRNVAIGVTALLLVVTTALTMVNVKQQGRIDDLEAIRMSTANTVETEVQRYLANNGSGLLLNVMDESGTTAEDLMNDAFGNLVNSDGENMTTITMEFTEAQKAEIAKLLSEITYDSISEEVLTGQEQINVSKMENEIASAVTDVMMNYVDNTEKNHVTVEGDTDAIVDRIVAQLNAEIVKTASDLTNAGNTVTEKDVQNAISKEEIEKLVKEIISSSSVTKENKTDFENTVVNQTIESLKKYNIVKAGTDGKDGKDGKDAVLTEEDTKKIVEDIKTAAANGEAISVYGEAGDGILNAYAEGRNIVLTIGKPVDTNSAVLLADNTQETLTIENAVGNSLIGMELIENSIQGDTTSADPQNLNKTYELVYYTQFEVDNTSTEVVTNKYCSTHGKFVAVDADTCGTQSSNPCSIATYYKTTAGTVQLNTNEIKGLITDMKDTIAESLAQQMGADNVADIVSKLDSLNQTVGEIETAFKGSDTQFALNDLLNGTSTGANGEKLGSLSHFEEVAKANGEKLDTLNSLLNGNTGTDADNQSYTTVYDQFTERPIYLTISVDTRNTTLPDNYYVVEADYAGKNAIPTISLIGASRDFTAVPDTTQSKLWSMCKYIKVNTETNKIEFYFAVDDENGKILQNMSGTLYFALTNTGIPSTEKTAVLTNQTITNYGVVRVKDYTNGILSLEGYETTDTLIINDFVGTN